MNPKDVSLFEWVTERAAEGYVTGSADITVLENTDPTSRERARVTVYGDLGLFDRESVECDAMYAVNVADWSAEWAHANNATCFWRVIARNSTGDRLYTIDGEYF